jgi:hypothetical protein
MREEVMSAGVLFARPVERERVRPEEESARQEEGWNPEVFAREQIRSLVRRVFFSHTERPVRQVVFSALEPETDVRDVCRRVGEALALETESTVAVVGEYSQAVEGLEASDAESRSRSGRIGRTPLRQAASRLTGNLWLVAAARKDGDCSSTRCVHSHLQELRTEFEYSIVEASAAGGSHEATALAQFADGIILVLSAHRTRRIMARKIKETLEGAQVRILGTVLSDRIFPIPEEIYRRL